MWLDEVREDGRMVGAEEWQEKVYDREEWRRLLRTARNHCILFMPMDWLIDWLITVQPFADQAQVMSGHYNLSTYQQNRSTDRAMLACTYFVLFIPISAATASSFVFVRLIKTMSIPSLASWKTDKGIFSFTTQSTTLLHHTQQRYAAAYKCAQLHHCGVINENVTDNIKTGKYLRRTDETETQKNAEHHKIQIQCFVYHWLKN